MLFIMTRDRVDIEEILFDQSQRYLSQGEEAAQIEEAAKLTLSPKMLEALYEVPEELASALAGALKTSDVTKLAALITWDIENYLNDNGGIEKWLK